MTVCRHLDVARRLEIIPMMMTHSFFSSSFRNNNLIKRENFIMLTKIIYLNLFSTTLLPSIYSTIKMSSSSSSSSIHSASINEIYNIPMKDISRPLPSILDEKKVQSLMETIQVKMKNLLFFFEGII